MNKYVICIIQIHLVIVSGFLLDHSPSAPNGQTNNNFLTLSEFYSEKQNQHYETERLRQDMERTFSLLSKQLENRIATLDSKIHDDKELERNNTELQTKVDVMMKKLAEQESEVVLLRNRTIDLEKENIRLMYLCNTSIQRMSDQVSTLNNTSEQQKREIHNLEQLKNIQPIQDMHVLQQQIQTLSKTTNGLSLNQEAHRQDVIALYSSNIILKNKTESIERATKSLESKTDIKIRNIEASQNKSADKLTHLIHDVILSLNETKSEQEKLITNFSMHEMAINALINKSVLLDSIERNLTLQITLLENTTQDQMQDIIDLQHLKDLPRVTDFKILQQQVQALSSLTQNISVNERARRQDLIGLYQSTLSLENRMDYLSKMATNVSIETEVRLASMEGYQNRTVANLLNSITYIGSELNDTKAQLGSLGQVGITSCMSIGTTYSTGIVLLFDDVVTAVGIDDLRTFKSNGKFTCTKPGLYQISVYILSYTHGAQFAVYKNGHPITNLYILESSNTGSQTGTYIAAISLQTGDIVWVQTLTTMYLKNGKYSCLTIIKI